jgi:chromosome segregation ATPase
MITFHKVSLYATLAIFAVGLAACSKRNPELETDYATKKASAETLIGQIDAAKSGMMADHDNWMKTLTDASAKPGADTSKINSLKNDLNKHMADGQAIAALEDSVKAYMNATPDQGDAFKNADDRLGTNFNDLNDKWKSFQDAHANLQKNIQQMAVTTAGAPMKDSTRAQAEIKKPVAKPEKKVAATPPANNTHKTEENHAGGVPRHSAH